MSGMMHVWSLEEEGRLYKKWGTAERRVWYKVMHMMLHCNTCFVPRLHRVGGTSITFVAVTCYHDNSILCEEFTVESLWELYNPVTVSLFTDV